MSEHCVLCGRTLMGNPRCDFCAMPVQGGTQVFDNEDCKAHVWDIIERKYRKTEFKGGKCGRRKPRSKTY